MIAEIKLHVNEREESVVKQHNLLHVLSIDDTYCLLV